MGRRRGLGYGRDARWRDRALIVANLLYLVGAVVIAAVGCLWLWLRHRRPTSTEYTVDSFRRGLQALAPDRPLDSAGRPGRDERGTRDGGEGRHAG